MPAPTTVDKGLVKETQQDKATVASARSPGADNGTTDCNTSPLTVTVAATGSGGAGSPRPPGLRTTGGRPESCRCEHAPMRHGRRRSTKWKPATPASVSPQSSTG